MTKTIIIKYDKTAEMIFNDFAQWDDGRIVCSDNTTIDYTEDEVVIKYINPYRCQLIFLMQEKSFHTIETEFGVLKLNVFTKEIIIEENKLTIIYELEGNKNKLVIEGV